MSKIEFKNFYLLNKLMTNLMLKGGYIHVKVGSSVKISEADLSHPDVVDAINKGWAEIFSEAPDTSKLPQAPVMEIQHDQYRGMTAEELLATKDDEPASPSGGATSEAIGRPSEKVEKKEVTTTAIGESAESVNTSKKGSKKGGTSVPLGTADETVVAAVDTPVVEA